MEMFVYFFSLLIVLAFGCCVLYCALCGCPCLLLASLFFTTFISEKVEVDFVTIFEYLVDIGELSMRNENTTSEIIVRWKPETKRL